MKRNGIFKVVLLTILIAIVCTWIFKAPTLTANGLVDGDRAQLGLFTISQYVEILLQYFFHIILVVVSMGAFYGVAYRIPAYRQLLDMLVEKARGKEEIVLGTIMALIAIIVSITGLQLGILFVFPFVISLVVLMGYNKLVAASVTVGSTIAGLIGTTLGTSTTYYIDTVLNTNYSTEMISKVALLVLALAVLIFNVIIYARKTRNETDKVLAYVPFKNGLPDEEVTTVKVKKSNIFSKILTKKKVVKKEEAKKETKKTVKKETPKKETKKTTKPAAKKKTPAKKSTKTRANNAATTAVKVVKGTGKANIWPLIVVFDLTLLIMILSVFDWSLFDMTWASDALKSIKEFEIGEFPIFGKILGNVNAFGQWSIRYEIPLLMFVSSGILALIYRVKFDDFIDGILEGMKKTFVPALTMILAYLVLIICVENAFQLHFIRFFLELNKGLSSIGVVFTMTLSLMFGSIVNVDTLYLAQVVLSYATTIISDTSLYPIIGVMTQGIYGLMMLIAPTSLVLIGTLSFLNIPYLQWIKHIWKVFLELLGILLVVFLILVLI